MSEAKKPVCGIVMPISEIDNCSESHWADVLNILNETISAAGFEPNLVSNSDEVGVIQKRIVQNLYKNPLIVCDVSGRNPNVMFELGMRLAFDRPVVVIKDDVTKFSFDTSPIEHVPYPRDLRFSAIVEFKALLSTKIKATFEASQDPSFTPFLGNFGEFKTAILNEKQVPGQELILDELMDIRRLMTRTSKSGWTPNRRPVNAPGGNEVDICFGRVPHDKIDAICDDLVKEGLIESYRKVTVSNHLHAFGTHPFESVDERDRTERAIDKIVSQHRHKTKAVLESPPSERKAITTAALKKVGQKGPRPKKEK